MDTYDDITQKHMLSVKQMGILEGEIDISKEELKEISLELGMTDEGWDYVMREADEKLSLARSHMQHKSYRECLKTAQDALLLNPYINGARGLQAKSYLLLAINEEDDSYLRRAKQQAEVTLDKEPNDKNALEVMSSVSSKTRLANRDKKKNPNKKLAIILGIIVAGLIFFAGVYFIMNDAATEESTGQLENIEKQMESAFETQEALIPKVQAILTDNEKDQSNDLAIKELKVKIQDASELKEQYELHTELGDLLSGIVYRKSNENPSDLLNDLRVLLEEAQTKIKTERKHYNDAIQEGGLKTDKL